MNENWEIYIKQFDGSAWVEVGTGSASAGGVSSTPTFFHHSQHPALTFDGDGIPYLAWTELLGDSSRARTYARRFVNGVWEETYPGSASEPIDDSPVAGEIPPEMDHSPAGDVVAAYTVRGASDQIAVRRLPEAADVPAAPPLTNIYTTGQPDLTWNRVVGAAAYQVQIARDHAFTQIVVQSDLLPADQTPHYAPPASLFNGDYFWRVQARSAAGVWGAWSAVTPFAIRQP